MTLALSGNKKPRFRNRGLCCGPIRASGPNQVDLSLVTNVVAISFLAAGFNELLDLSNFETQLSYWHNDYYKDKSILS